MKPSTQLFKEFDDKIRSEEWITGTSMDGDREEVHWDKVQSFISQTRREDIDAIVERLQRRVAVHREITLTHESYSESWHYGAIDNISIIITELQRLRELI